MKRILPFILMLVLMLSAFTFNVSANAAADVKSGTVTIDGVIDDIWNNADALQVSILKDGTATAATGYAKVLWSGNTLYSLVVVNDTTHNHEHADNYQKDSMELYIDIFNTKSESYGENQFTFTFIAQNELFTEGVADPSVIKYAAKITGDVYTYEVEMPLDKIGTGVALKDGTQVGFDVQINDNAEGTGRTAGYGWSDAENHAWEWPSSLGTVTLKAVDAAPAPAAVDTPAVDTPAAVADAPAAAPEKTPDNPKTDDNISIMIAAAILGALGYVLFKKSLKRV